MKPFRLDRAATLLTVLVVAVWACVEEPTSPAKCPDYCPGGRLTAVESLLATAISRDSSFQGYVSASQAGLLLASALPGIDSRPIIKTVAFPTLRVRIDTGSDTTTGPIVIDSMKLTLSFLRPNTVGRNLRVAFYQLPASIDSFSTFAGLAPAFTGTPLRVVNLDSLLALPGRRDSVTGDTVLTADSVTSVTHLVTVRLKFDSSQAPFSVPDSGRLALGLIVSADSNPALSLGSQQTGLGISTWWFYRVDSAGTLVRPDSLSIPQVDSIAGATDFDSFVFDAPALPPDANLVIGGVPSNRALLRIDLPRAIRDSAQIIRAQLLLVPTATQPVVTGDSVLVVVNRVAADLGAKSPIIVDTIQGQTAPFPGVPADTVQIELTTLFRLWQFDTTLVTSVYLRLLALNRTNDTAGRASTEAGTFTTLRFNSSLTPAFRPAIRLTYVPRIKFAVP